MWTIGEIRNYTNAKVLNNNPSIFLGNKIVHVDFDTRRLKKNSLFVALTIGKNDGHQFIEEAIQKGAKAILVSHTRFISEALLEKACFLLVEDTLLAFQTFAKKYREKLNIPIIGITGSNGKTTTKDIVSSLLETKYRVHKTQGNFNNHLGLPLTILQTRKEHEMLVLEMGMNHQGELDVLGHISKPTIVIITNIGESHIEHLGSRENIAHAKGELLSHLKEEGLAILPFDCEFKDILSSKTNEEKIYAKIGAKNNTNEMLCCATTIEQHENKTTFTLDGTQEVFELPILGEHNVLNSIYAILIARYFGFTDQEIIKGLKEISITGMRFERIKGKNNTIIINDVYNASPTSMKKSSETFLQTFPSKRKILVLGDMYELGEKQWELHAEVGKFLDDYQKDIECLVTIGEYSKSISGKFHGVKRHFKTKEEALKWLGYFQQEEFALFFKASRGMKLETMIEELKYKENFDAIHSI